MAERPDTRQKPRNGGAHARGPGRPRIPRREREQAIAAATKELFDERGMREAQIDDVARAVGINKALIYRHFSSKEDLYVQTVLLYLEELRGVLGEIEPEGDPLPRLLDCSAAFVDYCLEHPAFLDCCLALMQGPERELRETVSDGVVLRLGRRMADCLAVFSDILRDGAEAGEFDVEDPDLMANFLYTATLGATHLPRVGVGVRRGTQGVADLFAIDTEQIARLSQDLVLRSVGVALDDPRVEKWRAERMRVRSAA
jgi:AcrR family transcriptional regulator